jgi:predicted phage terminase large subunit-like protein
LRLADRYADILGGLGVAQPVDRPDDAEKYETSLREFYGGMWPVIEPGTVFRGNWHLDAICEHLEAAVVHRQILQLLINMPPRFSKSTLCSVALPAYIWTRFPHIRWLYASYAQSLATRDSVLCRRVIQSPWYQARWGHVFKLTTDQNIKQRYENDRTGSRIATSVGAALTGEGGDVLVVDDAHNVVEAESELVRRGVIDWYKSSASTRLNDPKLGVKVVVMQRVHQDDLAGHLLETGDWYHLCLPMEFEGVKPQWFIGWTDPREKEGDLLWPERYGREEVDKLKRALGSYGAAAQLQQRPTPKGGGIFKREWFGSYSSGALPGFVRVVESWDTATSEEDYAAYTVGTVWGEDVEGRIYLLDVSRGRWEFPRLKSEVRFFHLRHNGAAILVEDKSSGRQVCQELGRDARLPIIAISVGRKGKVARAISVSPMIEGGKVLLPEDAPWLAAFMEEILLFPNAKFADQVDSMTQALSYIRSGGATAGMDLS